MVIMSGIYQVRQYRATISVTKDSAYDMSNVNRTMHEAIDEKLTSNSILSRLNGAVGSALSIATLFNFPGVTYAAAALMHGVANNLSRSLQQDHWNVIYGGDRTLRDIYDWLRNNPNYVRAEIEFLFLEYEMSDRRKHRYVYGNRTGSTGNTYIVKRILTTSVEWTFID